jgi:hypothetical protein
MSVLLREPAKVILLANAGLAPSTLHGVVFAIFVSAM